MTTPHTRTAFVLFLAHSNGCLIENIDNPDEFLRILYRIEHNVKKAITHNQATKIIVDPTDVDDDEL